MTASEDSGFGDDRWQIADFVALKLLLDYPPESVLGCVGAISGRD